MVFGSTHQLKKKKKKKKKRKKEEKAVKVGPLLKKLSGSAHVCTRMMKMIKGYVLQNIILSTLRLHILMILCMLMYFSISIDTIKKGLPIM